MVALEYFECFANVVPRQECKGVTPIRYKVKSE